METAEVLEPLPSPAAESAASLPLSNPARGLLAVLAIGSATIHLVMVPSHAGQSLTEGLAFAAAGWFSLGYAFAVVTKPTRRWIQVGIVANLAFIAAWAVTRTAGLPFGPHPGHAESASLTDLTAVGLEAALILASLVLMARPRLGENLKSGALVMASILPVGVLVLTTAVLASPAAQDHAPGSHGTHPGDNVTATTGGVAGASDHQGASMDHSATGPMDHSKSAGAGEAGAGDHANPANPQATPAAADRCDWEFNTQSFWAANPPQTGDGTHAGGHGGSHGGSPSESANPPDAAKSDAAKSDSTKPDAAKPAADPTAPGTPAIGNKAGLQPWKPMTDKAKCARMKTDLAVMESMATKYPTAQSALDAGCTQVTLFVPGIARHIACFKYWMDDGVDVNTPEMLLYGGNQPWAPLVGLSYYTYGANPGDAWQEGQMPFHVHKGLCVKGALVIGGDGSSKEKCEAAGGKVMGKSGLMGHYWLPSCSSPDGVFSADNPTLDLSVAIYNDDPKFNPATGGDPSPLYKNPCLGSKKPPDTKFGQPGTPGVTKNESASGPIK